VLGELKKIFEVRAKKYAKVSGKELRGMNVRVASEFAC
jgi:hypothetical protein